MSTFKIVSSSTEAQLESIGRTSKMKKVMESLEAINRTNGNELPKDGEENEWTNFKKAFEGFSFRVVYDRNMAILTTALFAAIARSRCQAICNLAKTVINKPAKRKKKKKNDPDVYIDLGQALLEGDGEAIYDILRGAAFIAILKEIGIADKYINKYLNRMKKISPWRKLSGSRKVVEAVRKAFSDMTNVEYNMKGTERRSFHEAKTGKKDIYHHDKLGKDKYDDTNNPTDDSRANIVFGYIDYLFNHGASLPDFADGKKDVINGVYPNEGGNLELIVKPICVDDSGHLTGTKYTGDIDNFTVWIDHSKDATPHDQQHSDSSIWDKYDVKFAKSELADHFVNSKRGLNAVASAYLKLVLEKLDDIIKPPVPQSDATSAEQPSHSATPPTGDMHDDVSSSSEPIIPFTQPGGATVGGDSSSSEIAQSDQPKTEGAPVSGDSLPSQPIPQPAESSPPAQPQASAHDSGEAPPAAALELSDVQKGDAVFTATQDAFKGFQLPGLSVKITLKHMNGAPTKDDEADKAVAFNKRSGSGDQEKVIYVALADDTDVVYLYDFYLAKSYGDGADATLKAAAEQYVDLVKQLIMEKDELKPKKAAEGGEQDVSQVSSDASAVKLSKEEEGVADILFGIRQGETQNVKVPGLDSKDIERCVGKLKEKIDLQFGKTPELQGADDQMVAYKNKFGTYLLELTDYVASEKIKPVGFFRRFKSKIPDYTLVYTLETICKPIKDDFRIDAYREILDSKEYGEYLNGVKMHANISDIVELLKDIAGKSDSLGKIYDKVPKPEGPQSDVPQAFSDDVASFSAEFSVSQSDLQSNDERLNFVLDLEKRIAKLGKNKADKEKAAKYAHILEAVYECCFEGGKVPEKPLHRKDYAKVLDSSEYKSMVWASDVIEGGDVGAAEPANESSEAKTDADASSN